MALAAGCTAPPQEPSDDELLDRMYTAEKDGSRTLKPRESPFLKYLRERTLDVMDAVSIRLTVGPGLRAHARATKLVQIGIGKMGPAEGTTLGHTFPCYKVGYIKREGGIWKERSHEIGISLMYYYHCEGEPVGGNKTHFGEEDRGFWDVGAAVHWLLIGAEAEIRFDEALDAAAGVFGIDLLGDDEPYRDPDSLAAD